MSAPHRAGVVFCALAPLVLAGCIQSSTLLKIKPDGSGTIEQTMTMTAQAAAQFASLAAMGDDKTSTASKDKELFSEADARAAAAKMGAGVTFVSSEKIDTPERKGLRAVYAFTDVRKIALEEMTSPGKSGGADAGMPAKDPPMTFKFAQLPGGHALLTIVTPITDLTAPKTTPAPEVDSKMAVQGLEMMKMFMNGLKIDVAVQVDRLVKTNSPYVNGGTVTLLSMDFDKVLADPGLLERMNKAKTLADTKALLKDAKGFKVNLEPELTIEFAGRQP